MHALRNCRMVYKRFIKRGNKTFGPYYYTSKRVGEKVVSNYVKDKNLRVKSVFEKSERHRDYFSWLFLLFFAGVIAVLIFSNLLFPTGKVTMQVSESVAGETLTGTLGLGLKEGELIPASSIVSASLNEQRFQAQLFSLLQGEYELMNGEYYAENAVINGSGEGYGWEGYLGNAERVYFKLRLTRSVGDGKEKKNESDETTKMNETEEKNATKEEELNNTEETQETEKTNKSVELPVEESDTISVPVTGQPIENVNEPEQTESSNQEVVEPELAINEPAAEEGEIASNSEVSDIEVTETSNSLITGFAVHEKERIIEGSVIRGEVFEAREPNWDDVEIIEVRIEQGNIGVENIHVAYENKTIRVTTEYAAGERGFGEEYLNDIEHEIEVDLKQFNLRAEDGELRIELKYGDKEIVGSVRNIDVPEPEDNTTGTVIISKQMPDLIIKKNDERIIDLSNYFSGFEKFSLTEGTKLKNLSLIFDGNLLTIRPDENYTGVNIVRITAHGKNSNIESNLFSVLVTDATIDFETTQGIGRINEPVKWEKRISVDRQENFTIRLPNYAENISVLKVEGNATINIDVNIEDRLERSVLSGMVSAEISDEKGIISRIYDFFVGGIRRGITGNVVHVLESNEERILFINDTANEYIVAYYTPAPSVAEQTISEAKKVVTVSALDELGYINIISYTSIPEVRSVGQEGFVKVYWKEGERYVDASVSDIDSDGLLDRVEWVTPHLSNQSFEVSLTILNLHSYPPVGGNWTVEFNTTGIADLYIGASNGTRWTDYSNESSSYDLRFLDLRCGEEKLNYTWLDDGLGCQTGGCSVFIANYSCDQVGRETSLELTEGVHTLKFQFGDDIAYAYNEAGNSTTLVTTISGNNATEVQNLFKVYFKNVTDKVIQSGHMIWNKSDSTIMNNFYSIDFADLDRDGRRSDVVFSFYYDYNDNGLFGYYGNGTQKFRSQGYADYSNYWDVAAFDGDNDGYADDTLITTSGGGGPAYFIYNETGGRIWLNTTINDGSGGGSNVFGDFDGDGVKNDFAVAYKNKTGYPKNILAYSTANDSYWQQTWRFDSTNIEQYNGAILELDAGDINNDGFDDVIAVDQTGGHVYVINNSGNLIFNTTDLGEIDSAAVGDIDHDGYMDDVIVGEDGDVYVFRFNGTYGATYTTANAVCSSSLPGYLIYEIEVFDYDDDGYNDDFIIADMGVYGASTVYLRMFDNTCTQLWSASFPGDASGVQALYNLVVSDINGDGEEEFSVTENDYDHIYVFNKTGTFMWKFKAAGDMSGTGTDGNSMAVESNDSNLDGINELAFVAFPGYAYMFSGTPCKIWFNDTGEERYMRYNATSDSFDFNRTFSSTGVYGYNITCNATVMGYETNESLANNITIVSIGNATNCTLNDCIYVKNKTGRTRALFDSAGNVDLAGTLTESSVGTPDDNDLIVRNKAGTNLAWIDDVTGNMRLAGALSEGNGGSCTPPTDAWIVSNKAGNCKAYIDTSGNLWLAGTLGQNSKI